MRLADTKTESGYRMQKNKPKKGNSREQKHEKRPDVASENTPNNNCLCFGDKALC